MKQFPKDVRVIFKQFPLDSHSQAALAAEASLAAHAQGKFWELHDKMYANFTTINRARILVWAKETGLDMDRFTSELDSHKYAARVQAEEHQGEDAGVEGTPTFYINGKKLNASFDVQTVAPLIVDELKH
jgi:protein-disulfide isomerase